MMGKTKSYIMEGRGHIRDKTRSNKEGGDEKVINLRPDRVKWFQKPK